MTNFIEKPILLITEQFELNKDGIDFIKSLSDKKISIISVIGPKSSGKSFLATQLAGKFKNGFNIGTIANRTECCTKGIWIWGNPIIDNDTYILILDSQGFLIETEEQIKFNQKIFILLSLISSVVVYNYKKDEEINDINNISEEVIKSSYDLFLKLLPIFEKVKLDKKNPESKLSEENISQYMWLFRDYSISKDYDYNKNNDIINTLVQGNENYNNLIKNKIKNFSIPMPMEENDMLMNLYLDEDDDGKGGPFEDEYKKSFDEFKKKIFELSSKEPKMIGGQPMSNTILELILSYYTKKLSLNEILYINEPLNNLITEKLEKITNNILEKIKNNLQEKNNGINDLALKVKNSFDILSDNKTFEALGESKFDNNYIIESIHNIINLFGKDFMEKYINKNISEYNDVINNLITKNKNDNICLLLSNKISKKEEVKNIYNNFKELIMKDLENNIFSEKNEFISSFPLLKQYFEKCIFSNINQYIENIDNFIDVTIKEKEQQKTEEINKIIEEKNTEINNNKNETNKLTDEINDLKKNMELKENEFTNNLKIKKEEYEKLEQEKNIIQEKNNNLENDKKNLIEKNENLQKNLDELTNKNKELEKQVNDFIEKEKQKPKPQMVNVKEEDLPKLVGLFNEIESITKDYSESLKLLNKNKSKIFYHEKFIEDSKNNINNNCAGWVEELKKVTKERFESKDDIYNEEMNKLKEEKNKINNELVKVKEELEKLKEENKNIKEQSKLKGDIEKIIEQYKKDSELELNMIKKDSKIHEEQIEEQLNKKIEKTQIELSELKIDVSIKEDELKQTMDAFRSLLEKNKKNFELYLKKLPTKIQEELKELGRRHKLIK